MNSPATNQPRTLWIRADASPDIGSGHVLRMFALAQAYRELGGEVKMASVSCLDSLKSRLSSSGIPHVDVGASEIRTEEDGAKTSQLAEQDHAEWLVVDGYQFDYPFQRRLQDSGLKVMCVDDFGDSDRWSCDALLNQNLDAERFYPDQMEEVSTLFGVEILSSSWRVYSACSRAKEVGRREAAFGPLGGSHVGYIVNHILDTLEDVSGRKLSIRVLLFGG